MTWILTFWAGLQSDSGLWIDVVRLSDVEILVYHCLKVLEFALRSGHTIFSSFLFLAVMPNYKKVKVIATQDPDGALPDFVSFLDCIIQFNRELCTAFEVIVIHVHVLCNLTEQCIHNMYFLYCSI